jgi:hypothetical protein
VSTVAPTASSPRPNRIAIRRALLSVSNKNGILEFAQALVARGVQLLSTGGTAALLQKSGIAVTPVEAITQFPEMLDGRVKTLHPAVHGGLLARRDQSAHMQALQQAGFAAIDLLVVNLYPFRETLARPSASYEDIMMVSLLWWIPATTAACWRKWINTATPWAGLPGSSWPKKCLRILLITMLPSAIYSTPYPPAPVRLLRAAACRPIQRLPISIPTS